jgi:AraC-like DNA-binding protein
MSTMRDTPVTDWARFRPVQDGGIMLMHAHFTEHSFERHSHDTYSIGVTLSGVQTFSCRGARHACQPGDVILFNPDEAHDGSRGTDEGFGYAMMYVEPALMQAWLDRSAGSGASRYFRKPVARDLGAAQALHRAAMASAQQQESLRAEELTSAAIISLLQRYGEVRAHPAACVDAGRDRMNAIRDYLDAHFSEDLTVAQLAREAGLSRVHLTRAFAKSFGMPPHAYLNSVRLRAAMRALLSGSSLAEAATSAGFADQSHFNRRFRGSMGVPPGTWLSHMSRMPAS